jgi:hypothetical protein
MAAVYGTSGNRWWVGDNVGETGGQSTIFGTPSTLFIGKASGYQALPSGNAADDRQFAAAAAANKGSSAPNTISVENVQWFNIQGPYTTQAAANAAKAAIQKANPAPGEAQQVANADLPTGWEQAIVDAYGALTSSGTWIRVVKVVIGGVLVIVGLAKLTGAGKVIEDVVK